MQKTTFQEGGVPYTPVSRYRSLPQRRGQNGSFHSNSLRRFYGVRSVCESIREFCFRPRQGDRRLSVADRAISVYQFDG